MPSVERGPLENRIWWVELRRKTVTWVLSGYEEISVLRARVSGEKAPATIMSREGITPETTTNSLLETGSRNGDEKTGSVVETDAIAPGFWAIPSQSSEGLVLVMRLPSRAR